MPRIQLIHRLFAVYAAVIVVCAILISNVTGARLAADLRATVDAQLDQATLLLRDTVGFVNASVRRTPSDQDAGLPDAANEIAREMLRLRLADHSHATKLSLTVYDAAGTVIASAHPRDGAARADAAADRAVGEMLPELIDARDVGHGTITRTEPGAPDPRPTRYVARPMRTDDGLLVGYVRAGRDLGASRTRIAQLQTMTWGGALVMTALALLLGVHLMRRMTRPLMGLVDAAMTLRRSGGALTGEMGHNEDEFGTLAMTFNAMNRRLKETLERLAADRNQLNAILASMAEGVVAVDRDERIVHMNAGARRMLRLEHATFDSVVDRPLWEIVRIPAVAEILHETMFDDAAQHREVVLRGRPDRVIDVTASPLPASVGGAVLVLEDITQLRQLETMRQDFVANVSHELKTPVTAIRGFVETLLDDDAVPPAMQQRFLTRARDQAIRMGNLVSDLLVLARLDAEEMVAERETIDARLPVADSVQMVQPAAEAKAIAIHLDLPETPLWLTSDEEALRQAVTNLIDNAIKYTPRGSAVWVAAGACVPSMADAMASASAAADDTKPRPIGEIAITVRDNGPGIAHRHQERIFERFYRIDKARSREVGGTGLGLAIVKHVARTLGGRVDLDSAPGRGSTFRIVLPVRRAGDESGMFRTVDQ
ncbi:MAG: ATP-binding protein [Acidobacteriota bacterium]